MIKQTWVALCEVLKRTCIFSAADSALDLYNSYFVVHLNCGKTAALVVFSYLSVCRLICLLNDVIM